MSKKQYLFLTLTVLLISHQSYAESVLPVNELITKAELEAGASSSIHAAQLTHYLEQNGFILATVEIGNNDELVVNLGSISNISINGLREANRQHAERIIKKNIGDVPTAEKLDRALTLINDMPGITGSFALEHNQAGKYDLIFTGTDLHQFGGLAIDNTAAEIGEEYRLNLHQSFTGILTGGDILRLQALSVDGGDGAEQNSIQGSYQFPMGVDGAYIEVGAGDYKTETEVHSRSISYTTGFGSVIVPGSITTHDYTGQSYYITSGYPLRRSHDVALYLIGQVDYSVDETSNIGESDVIHGDVGFFYSHQSPNGQSIHLGGYVGLGHSDSYVAGESNDYWSTVLVGAFITPLPSIDQFTELRLEGIAKISDKHLPNSKLMGLGDEDFLRGYPSSTVIGSSGFAGTVEIAHAYYGQGNWKRIAPYVFFDYGFVDNPSSKANNTNRPESHELASVGLGSHFSFDHNITVNTYVGVPLMENALGETPDPAAYLRLSWGW